MKDNDNSIYEDQRVARIIGGFKNFAQLTDFYEHNVWALKLTKNAI